MINHLPILSPQQNHLNDKHASHIYLTLQSLTRKANVKRVPVMTSTGCKTLRVQLHREPST